MGRELLCQSLRPVKGLGMLRLCCVNPGYQSIYQGSWTAVGNNGSQYLQLLMKGSKWKLGITAGYRATIANEYSSLHSVWQDWDVLLLACRCLWSHLFVTPSKGCWNPPTWRAAGNRSVCVCTTPVLAGTFETGRQGAEWGSVGLLISVSLFGNT